MGSLELLAYFVLGICFADLETLQKGQRIFVDIRKWPWYFAIPRDLILFTTGVLYGAYGEASIHDNRHKPCL
jgi:hypothetical protein